MKNYIIKIIAILSLIAIQPMLKAQKVGCMVLKEEISENYEGACKKGLAHGIGVATGIDKYEGKFKKGLPNGKGSYYYSDGATYKGNWHKGLRNGKGEYVFKIEGQDSVVAGYWKNDRFIGKSKNEKGYKITLRRGIEGFSIQRLNETDNRVEIYFERNRMRYIPNGLLLSSSSGYRTSSGNNTVFEDIKYPFSGTIRYSVLNKLGTSMISCELEYTIEKPGKWYIVLRN
ncbi:MAG: hypothetical protein B6I20_08485 [Bacteroidetes bacterium 4572_117]|nr:MAG: hypothetical protein B6I20_08485 [Bacteroidetes bacterium 4572_117]